MTEIDSSPIFTLKDPAPQASAMRRAVLAGGEAFLADRRPRRKHASAGSPSLGVVGK
jgi:thiazole synthase ThiGH ThiG subunit